MIRIFTVFILLLIVAAHSQGQSPRPVKGDNRIVIDAALPDSSIYKLVGRTLLEAGYTFKADKEFGTFKTDEKPLPKQAGFQFVSNVVVSPGKVVLTGTLRNGTTLNIGMASNSFSPFPIEYRNGNITMHRAGFMVLDELAHKIAAALSSTTITYLKQ